MKLISLTLRGHVQTNKTVRGSYHSHPGSVQANRTVWGSYHSHPGSVQVNKTVPRSYHSHPGSVQANKTVRGSYHSHPGSVQANKAARRSYHSHPGSVQTNKTARRSYRLQQFPQKPAYFSARRKAFTLSNLPITEPPANPEERRHREAHPPAPSHTALQARRSIRAIPA